MQTITTVYHISDLHIQYSRKEEIIQVFQNLINKLKEDPENAILVIAGDLLDKIDNNYILNMDILEKQLTAISNIMPIIVIRGNHDSLYKSTTDVNFNETLKTICKKSTKHPIIYPETSDKIEYDNVIFLYTDTDKKDNIQIYDQANPKNKIKIAIYHGQIAKENEKCAVFANNKIGDFKNFDYVLLGDTHTHAFLDKHKRIAYSGSLLQHKFDENLTHGILKWDLIAKKARFIEIPNKYGYVTINIDEHGNIIKTNVENLNKLPQYVRLRVNYGCDYKTMFDKINKIIPRQNRISEEYVICDDTTTEININTSLKYDTITTMDELHDIMMKTFRTDNKHDLNVLERELIKIEYVVEKYFKMGGKNKNSGERRNDFNPLRNYKNIDIKKIKFKNVLQYNGEYELNLSSDSENHVVAITGDNATGKTSIGDIYYFAITGISLRGKLRDLMNKRNLSQNTETTTEITLQVNTDTYDIIRHITYKNIKSDITHSVILKKNGENLNGLYNTKSMIDKYIYEKICCYDELILNSYYQQRNDISILKNKDDVLSYICQMCGVEIYDIMLKETNKNIRTLMEKRDDIHDKCIKLNISNTTKDELKRSITELTSNINLYETHMKTLRDNKLIEYSILYGILIATCDVMETTNKENIYKIVESKLFSDKDITDTIYAIIDDDNIITRKTIKQIINSNDTDKLFNILEKSNKLKCLSMVINTRNKLLINHEQDNTEIKKSEQTINILEEKLRTTQAMYTTMCELDKHIDNINKLDNDIKIQIYMRDLFLTICRNTLYGKLLKFENSINKIMMDIFNFRIIMTYDNKLTFAKVSSEYTQQDKQINLTNIVNKYFNINDNIKGRRRKTNNDDIGITCGVEYDRTHIDFALLSEFEYDILTLATKFVIGQNNIYTGTNFLFLDEVFKHISEKNMKHVKSILKLFKDNIKTTLLVSHNMEVINRCDRIFNIEEFNKYCAYDINSGYEHRAILIDDTESDKPSTSNKKKRQYNSKFGKIVK